MTMTQKILAAHAGLAQVRAGQLMEARLDLLLGNDVTTPVAINELERAGIQTLRAPEKAVFVLDHFTPNKDINSAQHCKQIRQFAKAHGIEKLYDVGSMGIEHALLPEQGLVAPGDCIVGADSHTCTYGALGAFSTGVGSTDLAAGLATGKAWFQVPAAIQIVLTGNFQPHVGGKDLILHLIGLLGVDGALYRSLEFTGPGVENITIDSRFTSANMAIECGAKNGIFPVDHVTLEYLQGRCKREAKRYEADTDAAYDKVIVIDLSRLRPMVAFPHLPSNARTVDSLERAGEKIAIDQVVIGSCTNGRMEDLRIAAALLRDGHIAPGLRCIVIPATQQIYLDALREGLLEIFVEAGCVVSTPTCGPCLGGHMGVLAAGERALATTNRNFVGRMGHPESEVYLAGPAVAAQTALQGHIGVRS
jgi:3-isopropylmalate/(R)-2-methylmalate dehydratase large subunit